MKLMSQQALNVVNAMYKNASMGAESISTILSGVKDLRLRDELEKQREYYQGLGKELDNVYNDINGQPEDIGAISKAFAELNIRLKTLANPSSGHIAELMITGTNMGIIELEKALNNNPDISWQLKRDTGEALKHEQKYIERLKEFL